MDVKEQILKKVEESMTRQEAIKHLKKIQTIENLSDETLSAFSNAIIALERWDGAEDTLDKVLKIIDRYEPKEGYYGFNEYEAAFAQGKESAIEALKDAVLALKGEQG